VISGAVRRRRRATADLLRRANGSIHCNDFSASTYAKKVTVSVLCWNAERATESTATAADDEHGCFVFVWLIGEKKRRQQGEKNEC
jgi:hypothetical protein